MDNILAYVEFTEELEKLENNSDNFNKDMITVLTPFPKIRLLAKKKGFNTLNTLDYFSNTAHSDLSNKIFDVMEIIDKNFLYFDPLGASLTYKSTLLFYSQFYLSHIFLTAETLLNCISKNNITKLIYFNSGKNYSKYPMLLADEKPIGLIAKSISNIINISFHEIKTPITCKDDSFKSNKLIDNLSKYFQSISLNKLSTSNAIIVSSLYPALLALLKKNQNNFGNKKIIYLYGGDNYLLGNKRSPLKILLFSIFQWIFHLLGKKLPAFFWGMKIDGVIDLSLYKNWVTTNESMKLELEINNTLRKIEINYKGIDLSPIYKNKTLQGINVTLKKLTQLSYSLHHVLDYFNGATYIAPYNVNTSHMIGEYSKAKNIKSVLITHGSHVPPSTDVLKREFQWHGRNLINGLFSHVVVQSPLADKYLDLYNCNSSRIPTGPILWGRKVDKNTSLKESLKIPSYHKVITHASSQKSRRNCRINLYETPEEYLKTIIEIAEDIQKVDHITFLVKFRPNDYCSLEDLKNSLSGFKNIIISVKESLLECLHFTDILISFSSTAIEEALEYKKSVLLYGGRGRFSYINCEDFSSTKSYSNNPAAVYSVSAREDLLASIEKILGLNEQQSEDIWQKYSIPLRDRVSFEKIINKES